MAIDVATAAPPKPSSRHRQANRSHHHDTPQSTHPQPHDLQRSPSIDPSKANIPQRSPRTAFATRPWAQPHTPRVYRSKVYHLHPHIPIHPSVHPTHHPPHAQTPFPRTSKYTHRVDQCGFQPYSTSTSTSTAFLPPPSDPRLRRGLHPANPHATVPQSSQVK